MKLRTLLELGRTSNLPTVWSNVLCGALLSGGPLAAHPLPPATLALLLVAGSAFYEGGMLLNDAFDAEIDARERPDRPIPAGRAQKRVVLLLGFGLLALGLVILAVLSVGALLAGVFTVASVLVYNRWHKGHGWAPIVMGFCRAGLYFMAALATGGIVASDGTVSPFVLGAAAALLLYIVGLTHVARFETGAMVQRAWVGAFVLAPLMVSAPFVIQQPFPLAAVCWLLCLGWTIHSMGFARQGGKMIGRAVVSLIAGVALVDATFIAALPQPWWALAALACFALTLNWQRSIKGT